MRHQSAMLDVEVGALLLPFWVCDYTLQGGDYRAFVNGFSGQVGGTSHVDSFRAGHSIRSLEDLAEALSRPDDAGERARLLDMM